MARATGKEEHRITLDAASALTRRYRRGEGQQANGGVIGQYLGRGILDEILAQPGCIGIRVYYAQHETGAPTLVVVGVDAEANDLYQGVIAEETRPCPPFCAAVNPLNS